LIITCAYMWISVAKVYAQHHRKLQGIPEHGAELEHVQKDLGVLMGAIAKKGANFPVIQLQLLRLRAYLDGKEGEMATYVPPSITKAMYAS